MYERFRNLLTHPKFWRIVGFVSSVIGMLCYAWSLSFEHVGEKYHILKISLYGVVSFTIIFVMFFARKGLGRFSKSFLLKALVGVLALMLTSLYNFFSDKDSNQKTDVFNLISNGSFALMLLSLSKQIDLGFELELLNFYLGCLTIQLMKINLGFVLVGAAYCYLLNVLHSYSDFNQEIRTASNEEHVAIEIETPKVEERGGPIVQLYSILGIEIKNEEIVMYPEDLEAKLIEAMASGLEKEHCYPVFCSWRRLVLEERLLIKNLMMSIEEVQKLPLKYLKDEIECWIKASKDGFMTLFPNERHLCNRVFGFSSPFAESSFMEICHEPTIHLLNFANAVACSTSRSSPERLFKIVLVFETLNGVLPELESIFSGDCCVVLWNEAMRICKRLRDAIRGVFIELENLIRQDPGKVVVCGGGLHPTNHYLMNYLFAVCQCWKTLELAFDDEGSPDSTPSFSLSLQVAQILELLESNLKSNSKIYKDSSLCSIFMMNNWRYIVHKVKRCELERVLGDEWIQKHIAKMGQYLVNYQRRAWDEVLGMLNVDNDESLVVAASSELWREKVEMIKMKFEEICEMQGTWVVIDEQMRQVMKSSLKKILLLAFEKFSARFQNAVDPDRNDMDMHVDFGVLDVVVLIDKLFQGKDEHRNPRYVSLLNFQDFFFLS
ncbi:Exocyst complex component Exo70 [Sesbania bispinosa]|nr:Exocyst complex component Exo70 [Sesbania bispinosa]